MPLTTRSWILGFAAALGAAGCAGSVGDDSVQDGTPSAVSGATTLVRADSGKCLDVNGGATADGTNIQQWTCNGSGAQSFRLDDLGGGPVRIVNPKSGKCVDINGAGSADGTNIQLWTCNGTAAQSFVVEDQGGGYSRLRNPHSNKCVDVNGASSADGANVQLWTCNGTAAQRWKLGGGSGFVHPGVLVTQPQLDFVKAQIAASKEPWLTAYKQTSASSLASLGYTPHPVAVVQCGPYSNPDVGCSDEKNDAAAAYTHALLWYLGGDAAHAKKAIAIMNAWSSTLTGHSLSNAPLQSAWVGSIWPRAAEIIRYTYSGWSASEIAAFAAMLKNVYLPEVIGGSSSNGNWELSMIEATIGIGVFLDDQQTFDAAASLWTRRVPAYIYLASDGATPAQPPTGSPKSPSALKSFWYNPTKYVDGLSQETCRDLGHVQYGFAAMINAAETARIQGVDLYAAERARIRTALELHSQYLSGAQPNPTSLCGVALNAVTPDPMWEIAYNELANRDSLSLPNTDKLIQKIRPTRSDHHMIWETLTHAEVGSVGLP